MKELTRIITAQITGIAKLENDEEYLSKDTAKAEIKQLIEENVPEADDVVVLSVQDFERDLEENE